MPWPLATSTNLLAVVAVSGELYPFSPPSVGGFSRV